MLSTAVVLAAVVAVATAMPPAVPGLCANGGTGVGCSFDVTKVEAFGLDTNPLAQVVEWAWCDPACYNTSNFSPECDGCLYTLPDYPDMVYAVPQGVYVTPLVENLGCYEQATSLNVSEYNNLIGNTIGHSGFFHSWSDTTLKFYHYYYSSDDSLSLEYKMLIWHSLQMPAQKLQPTWQFSMAVKALPEVYDSAAYQSFIQQFGTHYMNNAFVGGMSLLTNYFHSCFVEQYGGEYVYKESSSSFFGIYNHNDEHRYGFNKTSVVWKQWSKISMKLIGGNAAQYGVLGFNHTISAAQAQEWEDSIKDNMSPIQYSFGPLSDLFNDPVREANFQQALTEYGSTVAASNQALVNSLVPTDPHIVPKWCKYAPHPPHYVGEEARADAAATARKLNSMPGCPALPSSR